MEGADQSNRTNTSESPQGETHELSAHSTDPPGQPFSVETAFSKLSSDFSQMTTLLGRICENLPNSAEARETRGPPGSNDHGRKRRHSVSSVSSEEESTRRNKSAKNTDDTDALSVMASDDDLTDLLRAGGSEGTTDPTSEANDALLTELSAVFSDEEKRGPKVTQQLADIANKRWDKKLAHEKITSILGKYSQPENCPQVADTRVNPEIWTPLNASVRKADLRMANLQQALQKATFATVMTTDKLLSMKNDPKSATPQLNELITNNVDVVALLGHAAYKFSNLRREKLKPSLKPEYQALCDDYVICKIPVWRRPRQTDPRCKRNQSHWQRCGLVKARE